MMGEAAEKGKEKWPLVRLGDVAKISSGGTPSRSNPEYWDNGIIPWVKIGDIDGKYINETEESITESGLNNSSAKKFPKGTLLYTIFATLGEVSILNIDAATNQAIAGIQFDDSVNTDYAYYFLLSLQNIVKNAGRGVAQNNINQTILKNIQIPLPPLPEQRRIAAVLDQVSSLIALRKAQLAKLDLLVKARFVEMFGDPVKNEMGWEVVQLSKLTTKIGSGATPRGGEESYTSEGISLIRSMNVHNGNFKYEKLAHINNEQAKILENVTVEENDILINITGASVARSCIVPTQILPARVNQHVSIIRCNINRVLPHYLNQLLLNQNYQNLLLSIGGTGGATREAITKQQLEQLPIPLPPLDFQKKFSIFIDTIQMKRHLILSGLNKIDILYKSLSHEYYK